MYTNTAKLNNEFRVFLHGIAKYCIERPRQKGHWQRKRFMRDFWHLKLQYGRDVPFVYCRLSEDWNSYPVGLPAAVYMSLIPFSDISKADRHITTGCTRNKDCCHLFLFRSAQTQMLTLSWLQEPVRFKGEYLGHTKWFRQVRTMKNICWSKVFKYN